MSDEEHHFESSESGASKTYPQQAGTIRKGGYLVIKGRLCKVVDVSTSKTGKHGHAKCHSVAIDIFNSKKLEDIVPSSHNCDPITSLFLQEKTLAHCSRLIVVGFDQRTKVQLMIVREKVKMGFFAEFCKPLVSTRFSRNFFLVLRYVFKTKKNRTKVK